MTTTAEYETEFHDEYDEVDDYPSDAAALAKAIEWLDALWDLDAERGMRVGRIDRGTAADVHEYLCESPARRLRRLLANLERSNTT